MLFALYNKLVLVPLGVKVILLKLLLFEVIVVLWLLT